MTEAVRAVRSPMSRALGGPLPDRPDVPDDRRATEEGRRTTQERGV